MHRKKTYILAALIMAAGLGWVSDARSADDLFDTKAAAAHIDKGLARLAKNDFAGAIREFEESAVIAPEAEAYYYIGYAYYLKAKKGDGEGRTKAREFFEKAYDIDPNFSPTKLKPGTAAPTMESLKREEAAEAQPAPPAETSEQTATAPATATQEQK